MLLRSALTLFALTCAAAVALPAQQAPDSLPAQEVVRAPEDSTRSASSPSGLPAPGPRLSPQFQSVRPQFAPSNGTDRSYRMAAASNTITISTLTLVLIVIIVVLLVT